MTAPDVNADVRARFETEFRGSYDLQRDALGTYIDEYTLHAWWGYRAAHADLAGEVRELVRASQAMLDGLAVAEPVKRGLFQELRAALAKFTHQERP